MEKTVLKVEGMSCGHCVKTISKATVALPGVKSVAVDLKAKTVIVEYDPDKSPLEKIKLEIEEQGYEVVA